MGKRKQAAKSSLYHFAKADEGYEIHAPTLKGLVLSGGGARGIAYPGMMRAMEEIGCLENITHVSGASAGAMTSSFIALGYTADELQFFLTNVTFANLMDRPGYTYFRAKGERFQHILDLVYLLKIKEYIDACVPFELDENALKTYELFVNKIKAYDAALQRGQLEINYLEDIVNLSKKPSQLEQLDAAFKPLMAYSQDENTKLVSSLRFTFSDFEALRSLLPLEEQHKIKHLSMVTTNKTKKLLVVHHHKTSPNESVSALSQASGAHPFLFSPIQTLDGDLIADGALQDNMPSHVLEELGLSAHEILCVALTSELELKERLTSAKGSAPHKTSSMAQWLDTWLHSLIGTKVCDYLASSYNREKFFYHFGNMLFLNAGDISITNINPTDSQKQFALDMAYDQTKKVFKNRNQHFSNAVMAMLFLGDIALEEVIHSEKEDPKLLFCCAKVKNILGHQKKIVNLLKTNSLKGLKQSIKMIQKILNHKELNLTVEEQDKALALCYMQINLLSDGLFESYCNDKIEEYKDKDPEEVSWWQSILRLLHQCLEWVVSSVHSLFSSLTEEINELSENVDESILTKPKEFPSNISSSRARFFHLIHEEVKTTDNEINIFSF